MTQVLQDFQVVKVPQVLLGLLDNQQHLLPKEILEILVVMDGLEHLDHGVMMDNQELLVSLDSLGKKVLLETMVLWVFQAQMDSQGTMAILV